MTMEEARRVGTPAALLRSAPRVAAVLDVLRRHGFADVLVGGRSWPEPARVRGALDELGVVFVKFGQVLSTRSDLLPDAYLAALQGLQDQVSPLPAGPIRDVIREELGADPHDLYKAFEDEPLASASVAQVHTATLNDGRAVVVKVQRPGIEARLADDLLVLAQLAAFLDLTVPRLRPFDLPSLVRDFQRSLQAELDFEHEAQNIRLFQAQLAGDERVWIPTVIGELSTGRVLTLERSHGVRLEVYTEQHPGEAPTLARRLGGLFVRQVFRDGLFHADPHPGNVFVMADGVLCLHDFGMIGEISEPMREALVDLVEATVSGNARAATNAYLDLGLLPRNVDRERLEDDIGKLVADIRGGALAEVSVGHALESLGRVGGRYRIRNPGAFMLLARAFVTLEGILARLDPGVSFVEVFAPAFTDAIGLRMTPSRLRRDALAAARALDKLAREAPDDVRRILRQWGDGTVGRVTVVSDPAEASSRTRTERSRLQILSAGFLAVAGAILWSGSSGLPARLGAALLGLGAVVLAYRLVRG